MLDRQNFVLAFSLAAGFIILFFIFLIFKALETFMFLVAVFILVGLILYLVFNADNSARENKKQEIKNKLDKDPGTFGELMVEARNDTVSEFFVDKFSAKTNTNLNMATDNLTQMSKFVSISAGERPDKLKDIINTKDDIELSINKTILRQVNDPNFKVLDIETEKGLSEIEHRKAETHKLYAEALAIQVKTEIEKKVNLSAEEKISLINEFAKQFNITFDKTDFSFLIHCVLKGSLDEFFDYLINKEKSNQEKQNTEYRQIVLDDKKNTGNKYDKLQL